MKKTISLLLAVIMATFCFGLFASADERTYVAKDCLTQYVVTKETHKDSNGDSYTYTWAYDSKGNLTKETYKNANGDSETYTYSYDSKGNLTKKTRKESNGYSETYTWAYDNKGNQTKETYKDSNGYSWTYTYAYDSKGNMTKQTYKNSNGSSSTSTWAYDSKGNQTKETYQRSDGFSKTCIWAYDSKGNQTKETYKNSNGDSHTYTRTYKKLSNPIFDKDGIRLSDYAYTYNGKAKKPVITIKDKSKGVNYKVTYKNNVKPGKAKAIISFFDGSAPVTVIYEIAPAKVTGLKATNTSKTSATLTWTKTDGADKYIVYRYNEASNKYVKVATVSSNKATIKNLKSASNYIFCVKAVGGGVSSASYSEKLTIKTK